MNERECWMVVSEENGRFLWAGETPEEAENYRLGYGRSVTSVLHMREVPPTTDKED